jgi:hypothetical protein
MALASTRSMIHLFIGLILMSVGLGMIVTVSVLSWLRGDSFVWWFALLLLTALGVVTVGVTVAKRIA